MFQLKLNSKRYGRHIKKQTKKTPLSPALYVPPPLLTEKEIEIEINKANEEFIKTSLLISKDELDQTNESTDQKNKKIMKDIIDPSPGLFIDNQLKPNKQNFQNTTNNFLIFHIRYKKNLMTLCFKNS